MVREGRYRVYSSVFMLAGSDLYSDTDTDPLIAAELEAICNLAYDNNGNRLPYSISVSIFGQEWDRDVSMFEEKELVNRRWDQKLAVHVIVFNSLEDKEEYDNSENIIIERL